MVTGDDQARVPLREHPRRPELIVPAVRPVLTRTAADCSAAACAFNRGGDRQLNHALHIIAVTRAQRDPATPHLTTGSRREWCVPPDRSI